MSSLWGKREEGDQTRKSNRKLDWKTPLVLHFQTWQPLNTFSYLRNYRHRWPGRQAPHHTSLRREYITYKEWNQSCTSPLPIVQATPLLIADPKLKYFVEDREDSDISIAAISSNRSYLIHSSTSSNSQITQILKFVGVGLVTWFAIRVRWIR